MFFFIVKFWFMFIDYVRKTQDCQERNMKRNFGIFSMSGVTITKKVRVYGQVLYGVQAIVYDLYCKKGEQDSVR